MKLILVNVANNDADSVIDSLLDSGYRTTRLASTGGFLREGNTTLMIGVEDEAVAMVIDILKRSTRPASNRASRATLFVLKLDQHERL